jgi:hypothetical protein
MISRYARARWIWGSSKMRIKERLADGNGGEMRFNAEREHDARGETLYLRSHATRGVRGVTN